MIFIVIVILLLTATLYASTFLSPYTERMLGFIWEDPTTKMKMLVAKRVKELCVDGTVPIETAAMMISKENNIMEEHVRELMRTASASPEILRLAFGSRAGGLLVRALRQCRVMED